jgi:hypothetical protein
MDILVLICIGLTGYLFYYVLRSFCEMNNIMDSKQDTRDNTSVSNSIDETVVCLPVYAAAIVNTIDTGSNCDCSVDCNCDSI